MRPAGVIQEKDLATVQQALSPPPFSASPDRFGTQSLLGLRVCQLRAWRWDAQVVLVVENFLVEVTVDRCRAQLTIQVERLSLSLAWEGQCYVLCPGPRGLGRGKGSFLSLSGQAMLTQHWPHYSSPAPITASSHTQNKAVSQVSGAKTQTPWLGGYRLELSVQCLCVYI